MQPVGNNPLSFIDPSGLVKTAGMCPGCGGIQQGSRLGGEDEWFLGTDVDGEIIITSGNMGSSSSQAAQQQQPAVASAASGTAQDPTQTASRDRLTERQLRTVETNLKQMLSNSVCKNFVTGVLKELGKLPNGVYSTDLLDIFKAVRNQTGGGIFLDKTLLPGHGNAFGSVGKGTADINLGDLTGPVAAHETIHVAAKTGTPTINHPDMALAAFKSAAAMNLKVFMDLPQRGNRTPDAFSDASATYFAQTLYDSRQRIKPVWVTK